MATIRQIEANRRNAKLSTGPRTSEGKDASTRNSLSTGIYAGRESVLPHEDPGDLEKLTAEYFLRFAPTSPEERCLVDSLVSDEWMLRRFRRIEGEMLTESIRHEKEKFHEDKSLHDAYRGRERTLERLQHRINATRKSYLKTLDALRELQRVEKERAQDEPARPLAPAREPLQPSRQPVTPEIGFVPSISSRALAFVPKIRTEAQTALPAAPLPSRIR